MLDCVASAIGPMGEKNNIKMQISQNLSLSSLIVSVSSAKIALIGLTNGYTTVVTSLMGPALSGYDAIINSLIQHYLLIH